MISFGNFNRDLGIEQRKLFKQYEKVSYKLINTTHAIKFNNICLQEHLCPKTIKIIYETYIVYEGLEKLIIYLMN